MSDCISIKSCQDCVARKCTWGIIYGRDGECVEDLDDLGDAVLGIVGPDGFCSAPDCRDTLVIFNRVIDWFYVGGISAVGAVVLGAVGVGIFVFLQRRRQFRLERLHNVREEVIPNPNNDGDQNQHENANEPPQEQGQWMPGIVRVLNNWRGAAANADNVELEDMERNYENMRRVVRNRLRQTQNFFGFLRGRNPLRNGDGHPGDEEVNERFWFSIRICVFLFLGLWTALMHFFAPQIQDQIGRAQHEQEEVQILDVVNPDPNPVGDEPNPMEPQPQAMEAPAILPVDVLEHVGPRRNAPRAAKQIAINSIHALAMDHML